jgi:PAS domain S-box-containing protein
MKFITGKESNHMTGHREWFSCDLDQNDALRAVLEGTASATGTDFFEVLVKTLSAALQTRYAWVTEHMAGLRRLRTLAFCMDGRLEPPFEIDIENTPCQKIIEHSQFVHYPDNIRELFPRSSKLKELEAVSYMGVPLNNLQGAVLGHLAVIDCRPMPKAPRSLALFKIFAARAAAELRRIRAEQALKEREIELRSLVDSAMDAIVVLDEAFFIVRMNPAARSVFGLSAEAGLGDSLWSYLTPESRDKISRLVQRMDTFPEGKRFMWIPDGLQALGPGRRQFKAEATISRYGTQGHRYLTLILRNVNDRIEAERRISHLRQERDYLRETIRSLDDIVGQSDALQQVLQSADKVADTDATVLVQGETGTGKELIALYLHQQSRRSEGAFIKLNCAALQPNLVESELFGHEAGAFTGATQKRKGRFELADGGTLFLDEVSEIPLELQAKLLRVLQEGQFERVGGSQTLSCDVRVVAATNRRLNEAVQSGQFRPDLFYRLNVYPIRVPPLRERREDIPLLVNYFLPRIAQRIGKAIQTASPAALDGLLNYDWPGNVRELKNVLERAVITSPGPELRLPESPGSDALHRASNEETTKFDSLAAMERRYIARVLETTGWRLSGPAGAAKLLDLNPSTLRYRIKKLRIRKPWEQDTAKTRPAQPHPGHKPARKMLRVKNGNFRQ